MQARHEFDWAFFTQGPSRIPAKASRKLSRKQTMPSPRPPPHLPEREDVPMRGKMCQWRGKNTAHLILADVIIPYYTILYLDSHHSGAFGQFFGHHTTALTFSDFLQVRSWMHPSQAVNHLFAFSVPQLQIKPIERWKDFFTHWHMFICYNLGLDHCLSNNSFGFLLWLWAPFNGVWTRRGSCCLSSGCCRSLCENAVRRQKDLLVVSLENQHCWQAFV